MAEYEARHAANLDWLEATFREARRSAAPAVVLALHADLFHVQRCGSGHDSGFRAMREAIGRAAAAFGRPVLLIHGEGHAWLRDEPYPDAPNLTRLMVPGNRETPAVRVMVEPEATAPFAFSLMGPQGRPDQPGC
jgi:hypothetical protein